MLWRFRELRQRLERGARGAEAAQVLHRGGALQLRIDGGAGAAAINASADALRAREQLRDALSRLAAVQVVARRQALDLAELRRRHLDGPPSSPHPTPGHRAAADTVLSCDAAGDGIMRVQHAPVAAAGTAPTVRGGAYEAAAGSAVAGGGAGGSREPPAAVAERSSPSAHLEAKSAAGRGLPSGADLDACQVIGGDVHAMAELAEAGGCCVLCCDRVHAFAAVSGWACWHLRLLAPAAFWAGQLALECVLEPHALNSEEECCRKVLHRAPAMTKGA